VQKFAKRQDSPERERITRKKNRWFDHLNVIPVVERYALLSALEEISGTTPS
jgi:hypothetical protein